MEWSEIYRRLRRRLDDGEAWTALEEKVRRWVRRDLWTRGSEVVDDVVADTCSDAVMGLAAARGPDTFAGFVSGHYLNARRRALSALARTQPLEGIDPPAPEAEEGPDEEELAILRRCLGALPERERRAVELRFFEEAPYDQVSGDLGVTGGNARRIVFNALARLRRCAHESLRALRNAGRPA